MELCDKTLYYFTCYSKYNITNNNTFIMRNLSFITKTTQIFFILLFVKLHDKIQLSL